MRPGVGRTAWIATEEVAFRGFERLPAEEALRRHRRDPTQDDLAEATASAAPQELSEPARLLTLEPSDQAGQQPGVVQLLIAAALLGLKVQALLAGTVAQLTGDLPALFGREPGEHLPSGVLILLGRQVFRHLAVPMIGFALIEPLPGRTRQRLRRSWVSSS